ncbi:MAG: extracellular solute-binding protein [Eubacteriales bacterium]|nr:extracellular solute-binding protein [Eubacteriales bacterium]
MKFFKAIFVFVIISAVLLSTFACGEQNGNTESKDASDSASSDDNSSAADESETETESTDESAYEPAVRDLDGKEIRFLVAGNAYSYYESFEIYADELTDEVINDAVYNRNQTVQDKYNCHITAEKSGNVANDMRTYVSSGLDTFDVYMPMINDAVKMVGEGLMLDLKTLDDLMLEKSWWDQKANEGLEINGKLYFSTGDISVLDNDCTMVMFFNKKLTSKYQVGDLYQLVKDYQWTLDKVYELSRVFTQNIDDDTVWNEKDNYGLHVAFNAAHSFYFGCGGTIAEKSANGGLTITIASESNQKILSDVFEISYKPDVLTNKLPGCNTFEAIRDMFLNEQVMFTTFALVDIKSFRNAEGFDFGILPYPLYNTEQDEYRCLVSTALVPCVCIPSNCANPEDTALIVEAMAYYSVDTLTKAYYVKTLKGRDLVDEASEEMLDIIFASRVYDLGFIYNFGGVGSLIEQMNNASSSNFASYYEAIQGMVESKLQETLDSFK